MKVVDTLKNKMQKKASENPFYGKKALLTLMQQSVKAVSLTPYLNAAWDECKNDKIFREAFFVIVFSVGDITNRQHNIFGKAKIDAGGNSRRLEFMECMTWMVKTCPQQYNEFLKKDIFRQYTCLFNILGTQVRTRKGTKTVEKVINMLEGVDKNAVAEYLARIIRSSNPVEKSLIAKWLVNPRTSKRQKYDRKTGEKKGSRDLMEITKKLMKHRTDLYLRLSEVMSWQVIHHKSNYEFEGLKAWKKEYNVELESVLFSSGKVKEFDEQQFISWLNTLPSGARYRVRRRLLDGNDKPKSKWVSNFGPNIGTWFLNWENAKSSAQEEQRVLEEKVRQGDKSEETKEKLEKVKKEAKFNTGAEDLFTSFHKMLTSKLTPAEFDLTCQSILDKVKFEVPVLVIADRSGSMAEAGGLPIMMAQLATTIAMLKNPSDEVDNLLVTFGSGCDFYTDRSTGVNKPNRFMQGTSVQINKIVDRTAPFRANLATVSTIVRSLNEGTDFEQVSMAFKKWIDASSDETEKALKREQIQAYPVFLLISDGDLNNGPTATESMARFQRNMMEWFGWSGVVVVWNVSVHKTMHTDYFAGLPNVIHYFGFNMGIINTIFTKIHDLDIIDVFTPLKSLHESNRYQHVKDSTL